MRHAGEDAPRAVVAVELRDRDEEPLLEQHWVPAAAFVGGAHGCLVRRACAGNALDRSRIDRRSVAEHDDERSAAISQCAKTSTQ
jgi:hypothetical protein